MVLVKMKNKMLIESTSLCSDRGLDNVIITSVINILIYTVHIYTHIRIT